MITCVKGGPLRRDVVQVCGARKFLSRYNRLTCYLARSHVRTKAGLPALLLLSAMCTMKFWLRLKQPVSWFQSEVAFTILKNLV